MEIYCLSYKKNTKNKNIKGKLQRIINHMLLVIVIFVIN